VAVEPVAAAWDCLYPASLRPVFVQDASQPGNLHREIGVGDDGVGPHRGNDLVLRNERSWPFYQNRQYVERAKSDLDGNEATIVVETKKTTLMAVKAKIAKAQICVMH
jgi:hypothetical protein